LIFSVFKTKTDISAGLHCFGFAECLELGVELFFAFWTVAAAAWALVVQDHIV
jgi:hypothetical protein